MSLLTNLCKMTFCVKVEVIGGGAGGLKLSIIS